MGRRVAASFCLALVLAACHGHHGRVPDGAVTADAGAVSEDSGRHDVRDAGPVDAGVSPPGPECLRTSRATVDSATYGLVGALGSSVRWRDVLSSRSRAIVAIDPGTGSAICLGAIRDDLSIEWSTIAEWSASHLVPATLGSPMLAMVGGRPHLFAIYGGLVVHREIDPDRGSLGPELEVEGWPEPVEWVDVGGNADGGFLVVWNEGWVIDAQAYAPDGTPFGEAQRLTTNGRYPRVAADGDRYVVGYHELSGGAVTGPVTVVLDVVGAPLAGPTYPDGPARGSAFFAERTERGLAAAWAVGDDVRAALLSDALAPVVGPHTVAYYGSLADDGAVVSGLATTRTGAVVAHYSHRTRGGGWTLVPFADPSSAVSLGETTAPGRLPLVAAAGDAAIGFVDGDARQAVRLGAP